MKGTNAIPGQLLVLCDQVLISTFTIQRYHSNFFLRTAKRKAIPPYQKALDESGYNHKLTYNPQPQRNRNRQRKIVWYNPPWNANVKTNLGRKFLNIIDRCFSNGHPLHKILNKHTLKLSYSCMPNMKSMISSHNKAVLSDYHQ